MILMIDAFKDIYIVEVGFVIHKDEVYIRKTCLSR
jgi:hypothetical protein